MQVRVLTLRYSTALGGFDDSELEHLATEHDLLEVRDHVVVVAGVPCVVLVVAWQRRSPQTEPRPSEADSPSTDRATSNGPRKPVADVLQGLDASQRERFEAIRAWRVTTAHKEGVPPYVILTNRQLVEVAKQRPGTRAALGKLDGLGKKKLERYGGAILDLLHPATADQAEAEDSAPGEEPAS